MNAFAPGPAMSVMAPSAGGAGGTAPSQHTTLSRLPLPVEGCASARPSSLSPRGRACRTGFTLVEVIVASCILLISFGALLMTFLSAKQSATAATQHTHALSLARTELERCQALPFNTITSFGPVAMTGTALGPLAGSLTFTVYGNTGSTYKILISSVTWTNAGMNKGGEATLSSIVAKN